MIRRAVDNPDRSIVTAVAAPGDAEQNHKVYASPILSADGRAHGRVVLYHDMTLEKRFARRLEREVAEKTRCLEEALAEREDLDRAKSGFIANMSHELRTPLNHILAYAQSLQDGLFGAMSGDQAGAVDKIMRGADRLRDLINDVLDFSRLEAGRVELHASEVDVAELVGVVLEFVWGHANEKRITLSSELAPDLPAIHGDFGKLHQVLTNLLTNALKFTPVGGRVWVSAETAGGAVKLGVHDTGIGISPEHHARLFERFYQVDDTHTREYGGTGLGLAIVRQLVELHGGRLWLESDVGTGSHFWVDLPMAPLLDRYQDPSSNPAEHPIPSGS